MAILRILQKCSILFYLECQENVYTNSPANFIYIYKIYILIYIYIHIYIIYIYIYIYIYNIYNDHCDLYTPDGCIGRTNSYKYLGVWLDSSLSMDKHLNNGNKMAYQKVFKLKKLRKQMSTNTAMLVYKQTILPYFEYCDFLIDACSKREQDKIEKLQYRALRIIHKMRNPREVRRVDLLQLSGMKELRIRRKCHLLNQMHDWKKRGKWLKKQNRTTRNQPLQQFYLPKPKTEEVKKSPYYRGAKLWLKLPPNVRQMEEKEEFKKATKKHFGL